MIELFGRFIRWFVRLIGGSDPGSPGVCFP